MFRDLIHTYVKASDGYTYGLGNSGYIYRRDADAFWLRVYKDADGAILGGAEWFADTGKAYLHWATLGKMKRKELPGLSNWNDVEVIGEDLTPATWHTMREAGGALMIANGPAVAKVGFDESYTNNAFNLIPGNIANTIVERSGRSITGTARAGDLTRGVNGAIDAEVPLAQIGPDGEVFFVNGNSTVPVTAFPGGGKVNPGGVANDVDQINFFEHEANAENFIDKQSVGNMALFGVFNATQDKGGIYTMGRKNKNHPFVMNLEHQLNADEIGAVVNVTGTRLLSYRDGSSFGVKAVDPNNKATGTYEGLDLRAKLKKPGLITEWTHAVFHCAPLPSGTSFRFLYRMNKVGSFVQAFTGDNDTNFDTEGAIEAVFRISAKGKIFEPQIVLVPSGNTCPEIYKAEFHFN